MIWSHNKDSKDPKTENPPETLQGSRVHLGKEGFVITNGPHLGAVLKDQEIRDDPYRWLIKQ